MAELTAAFARPEHARALAEHAPPWALEERLEALRLFETTPVETSPLFIRHVITDGAFTEPVELAPPPHEAPEERPSRADDLEAAAWIDDGAVTAIEISEEARRLGVCLASLFASLRSDAQRTHELLSVPSTKQRDKFAHLTRAFYQDGVILDIPPGVRLERPIRIFIRQRKPKLASFARIVVRLGAAAQAEILESHLSQTEGPAVVGVATEALVADQASLRYSGVANFGPAVRSFVNRQAAVGAAGRMQWSLGNFGGLLTKTLTQTLLEGDGSRVKHAEVVFGAESQKFDVSSFVTHLGKRAVSDVLAKAALRHRSRANVKGMITIDPKGHNADSYLGQFALLLDPQSRSVAIPGLEIETSQVIRAKHAAAVSQIDDNQTFYLMSRGVSREAARRLIVEGFLHPVIAGIGSESLRDEVSQLISSKWG